MNVRDDSNCNMKFAKSFARLMLCICGSNGVSSSLIHYTSSPKLEWKVDVLGRPGRISTPGMVKNNAIVTSHTGDLLYMTFDDGSLVVGNATSGATLSIFVPDVLVEGSYTSNDGSGVCVSRNGDVIYAVHDSPPQPIWNGTFWYDSDPWYIENRYGDSAAIDPYFPSNVRIESKEDRELSRIISLDWQGKLRWTHTIEGVVIGTPLFGSQQNAELVYVLHNKDNIGRITILKIDKEYIVEESTILAANSDYENTFYNVTTLFHQVSTSTWPYAPASLVTDQNHDVLYWSQARSDLPGYDRRGKLYRTIITPDLNVEMNDGRYEFVGTPTKPIVSHSHSEIYFLSKSSSINMIDWVPSINGSLNNMWTGLMKYPAWSVSIGVSERNSTLPLQVAAILTQDDERMYLPGVGTSLLCLNTKNGKLLWSYDTKISNYVAQMVLSPDEKVVYSIAARSGMVTALDALSGETIWQIDCTSFKGKHPDCQDSVEAEFTLSPDGTTLYYGDIFGSVTSIRVAKIDPNSSNAPSASPSAIPSALPTQSPSKEPSALPSQSPSDEPISLASQLQAALQTQMPSDFPSLRPSDSPSNKLINRTQLLAITPTSFPQPTTRPTEPANASALLFSKPLDNPSATPIKTASESPTSLEKGTTDTSPSPSSQIAAVSLSKASSLHNQRREEETGSSVSPVASKTWISIGAVAGFIFAAVATALGFKARGNRPEPNDSFV